MPIGSHRHPWVAPPGPVDQVGRLSETVVAFAGAGRASTETVIAFAGEKWVLLVQFLGAEVMVVSRLPCWGRAVVMVVSMVAVQGRAVVLSVSTSPSCRASCAKKFALLGLVVGVSAKKFALHAQNTPKLALLRLLGELFRGNAAEGAVRGEFFRANRPCAQVL